MTTVPSLPPRDRALGRGVSTLIPHTGSSATPATEQAAAALAALETVPVQAGLLQAAAVLLEERARVSEDDAERAAAGATAALLRRTLDDRRADRSAPSS
ncbi:MULTISPECIES: hypothetical protein [unclassified Streptomyces]|uniref:hypothetical protein n=1 Tax=unclassified Streptomyces TaxID=2593676 RepID=UPI000C27A6B2|nr:hypothetical protein [Streptomyces sp. CB02959]PJN39213.1 hypothetical protein CG747_19735 [Streptomyces sp. CB02959]